MPEKKHGIPVEGTMIDPAPPLMAGDANDCHDVVAHLNEPYKVDSGQQAEAVLRDELHRLQEELAASQARFSDLYELAPVGYVTFNEAGLIQHINHKTAVMLGLPSAFLEQRPITHIIYREDQDIFGIARKKILETGEIQTCELRLVTGCGTPVWMRAMFTTVRTAVGTPELCLALSDINESKRSDEAFERDVLNSLPAHIAVLDSMGTILAVNEPWLRFGRKNGNSDLNKIGVGANYLHTCRAASEDADAYARMAVTGLENVLSGMLPRFTLEYPCEIPEGNRWFKMEVIPMAGKEGGAIVAHSDINERKQAQCLLAWEKSALESIASKAPAGQVMDGLMRGLEAQIPRALCSMLLLDADGKHLQLGAAPSLPEDYNRAVDGIAIGTGVGSCGTAAHEKREVIVSDISSDPLWTDYREFALGHGLHACWSTPIYCSQGEILGTLAIYHREPHHPVAGELEVIERAVHVISIAIERQKTEAKILRLNAELEQRVEERTAELQAANTSLTDFKAALDEHAMVSITDADGAITYANDKFCEISKYSRENLIGRDHRILNSGHHSRDFFRNMWETIVSGRTWKGEVKNRARDGSLYWSSLTIVPFLGEDGKPVQFIAIRTDISERKQAEERIGKLNAELENRAAVLETTNQELESFTYSVSHDLRTPLRAVDGFSHMVIKHYGDKLDDEGKHKLGVIRSEAQRMGRLIDDLLAFSRLVRQPIEATPIDMESMAREVFEELTRHKPERKLCLNLQNLPPARGSKSLIRQVWVNLISNAIKFTEKRDDAQIEIGTQEGNGSGRIYYIKDNGVGFDMRYADKLFGVFQRLHSQEEFSGTGVGLTLVQRIITRHGGRAWAEAELDRGAIFYFTLPDQPA